MDIAKFVLAAFAVAVLGAGPVWSATDGQSNEAGITATAYKPIPAGAAFRLQAEDSSELTYQVQEQLRVKLERLGYSVSPNSPLVLIIGTEAPAERADTPLPMKVGGGKTGLSLRFFLFGTNSSGLLQDSPEPAPDDYRISLSIYDQRTSGYLWRGVGVICRCGQGVQASSREIVPALADSIGRTVGAQASGP